MSPSSSSWLLLATLFSLACETDLSAIDDDGDGFSADVDCDDAAAAVNPDAQEVCDGVDNDCDHLIDDASSADALTWYLDGDGDGFGDPLGDRLACAAPHGYVEDASDCDDRTELSHPGADELCDGADNDCDGEADEEVKTTFYADQDADGFGDGLSTTEACNMPAGYVDDATDCDDLNNSLYPGADEIWDDGIDQDCDGADLTCQDAGGYDGDLLLQSEKDLAGFCDSYIAVCGDLTLLGEVGKSLDDLSCVLRVTGDLTLATTGLAAASLPSLEEVDGTLELDAPEGLQSLDLAALAAVGGSLSMSEAESLTKLDLSSLSSIGTDLDLQQLALLEALDLAALGSLGGELVVVENALLASLSLGSLPAAVAITLPDNPLLAVLDLGLLEQTKSDVTLQANDGLLDLSGLAGLLYVGANLTISDHLLLADISDLHGLQSIGGDLTITDNPMLSEKQAAGLVEAIGEKNIGGIVTLEGNGK